MCWGSQCIQPWVRQGCRDGSEDKGLTSPQQPHFTCFLSSVLIDLKKKKKILLKAKTKRKVGATEPHSQRGCSGPNKHSRPDFHGQIVWASVELWKSSKPLHACPPGRKHPLLSPESG